MNLFGDLGDRYISFSKILRYCHVGDRSSTLWLRCCATNRTVAGSIPGDVIGIFHWHNPSYRTMAANRNEYQEYFLGLKTAGA